MIHLVAHPYVDLVFPKVAPWLAKAVGKFTSLTLPDLLSLCSARRAFLFIDHPEEPTNALVGQFDTRGGESVFVVLAMGGRGGENWPKLFDAVAEFAKTYGSKAVYWEGRKGWQRVIPKAKVIKQTYRFEIGD